MRRRNNKVEGLDLTRVRSLIIELNGNIKKVAEVLKVDSEDLRTFVFNTPVLRRACDEVMARGVDLAVAVLFQGLEDQESYGNRFVAAKAFLKSRAAQRRGFHHAHDLELKTPAAGGTLTLTWLEPKAPAEAQVIEGEKVIEGEVVDSDERQR